MSKPEKVQPIERYRQLASTETIRRGFAIYLAQAAISQSLLCILFCAIVLGLAGFLRLLENAQADSRLVLWWLGCASVLGLAQYVQLRQRSFLAVSRCGLVSALALMAWWLSFTHFAIFPFAASALIGALLILALSYVPWPTQCQVALTTIFLGIVWWLWGVQQYPLPYLVGWLIALLAFVRVSSRTRISFVAHRCLDYLAKYCESASAEALPTLRLLASQLLVLSEENRAVMSFASGKLELIGRQSVESQFVDSVYPRALEQLIVDQRLEHGLVRTRDIGDQLWARLEEWLGSVPAHLFFIRIVTVVESREEHVSIFIPAGPNSRMSGLTAVFHALIAVCAVARVYLTAARSRFISSDVLLTSQRSASDKEQEINHLIHWVNNIAQDISVQCEELRQKCSDSADTDRASMLEGLKDLEGASRSLSIGVSDVKLLTELLHVSKFKRVESADLKAVLDDTEAFCSYRARRRGDTFTMTRPEVTGISVQVASRELFEAALRALASEAGRAEGAALQRSHVQFSIAVDDKRATFRVFGNGKPLGVTTSELLRVSQSDQSRYDKRIGQLKSIANFVIESGGGFEIIGAADGAPFAVQFHLIRKDKRTIARARADQWALLVDDNTQVTNFYGRVAQALNFKYYTADSVFEARRLIEREGRPHLVVTDIQLGDGSGLDFVRFLRERFGDALPVIVVSGNTQEDTRIQATAAGATKFLAKPVGRARLFGEIESLIQS